MFNQIVSVNTQTLTIGNAETDTDNDFTGHNSPNFDDNRSSTSSGDAAGNAASNDTNMPLVDAIELVRSQFSQQSQEGNLVEGRQQNIDWDFYMNEDEEFPITHHMRLLREEEAQQAQRAGVGSRLTAPPIEIARRRTRQQRQVQVHPYADTTDLRAKQIALLEKQIEVETLRYEEAKERIKLTTAQRKLAEIDLRIKENEHGATND